MRPFDDEYDDLDEFDSSESTRRLLKERHHHHKSAGRKRHSRAHKERWENDNEDSFEYDDFYDDEFGSHSGMRTSH